MARTSLPRSFLILFISVLAGVLVAGLALPVVGTAGIVARAGTDTYEALPVELTTPPLPQRSRLLAADGSLIATLFEENRVLVPLDRVPEITQNAVLAIEDSRFYEHNGLDLRGLARAFVTNQRAGEVQQGGSTLTQQYVKNVLVTSAETEEARIAATEQSTARKLREARYALAVEEQLDKREILERYLNIAYFGGGAYGVGTAAQRYFSKAVEDLTLAESALLAGLLQSPSSYDPLRSPEIAVERRNVVLRRMAETGLGAPEEVQEAISAPLELNTSEQDNGCAASPYPFFCDFVVREQVGNNPAFGADPEERIRRLFTGGYTLRTTLEPGMQAAADSAINRAPGGRLAGATVLIRPGTGDVTALAVSRPYGENAEAGQTTVPLATTPDTAGFQPGSTYKVFALVAALERGIPLSLTLDSPARYTSREFCNPGGDTCSQGSYRNYAESGAGTIDMREATARSTNTYFIQLAERVGVKAIARTAQKMGLTRLDVDAIDQSTGSSVLGAVETSVLELSNAYATLASGGIRCEPRAVLEAFDGTGAPLELPGPQCERAVEERVAVTATDVLTGVITDGTGTRASIGRPAAGKTGTSQNNYAAWFAGYTPDLASAVWIGNPRELTNTGLTGGSLPASIWASAMRNALSGTPASSFPSPSDTVASGQGLAVPDVVGMAPPEAEEVLRDAGFEPRLRRGATDVGGVPEGMVATQSPSAGRAARAGALVDITRSSG
jgi:membrane peptidoglycan carboxypeptidase